MLIFAVSSCVFTSIITPKLSSNSAQSHTEAPSAQLTIFSTHFCSLVAVICGGNYICRQELGGGTVTDVGFVAMETHNHVRLFSGAAAIMA